MTCQIHAVSNCTNVIRPSSGLLIEKNMHDLRCRIIWHQDPADNSRNSNFKAPGKPRNNQFWKEDKSTGG